MPNNSNHQKPWPILQYLDKSDLQRYKISIRRRNITPIGPPTQLLRDLDDPSQLKIHFREGDLLAVHVFLNQLFKMINNSPKSVFRNNNSHQSQMILENYSFSIHFSLPPKSLHMGEDPLLGIHIPI